MHNFRKFLACVLGGVFSVAVFFRKAWAKVQPQVVRVGYHAKREASFSTCSFPRSIIFSKAAGSSEMR